MTRLFPSHALGFPSCPSHNARIPSEPLHEYDVKNCFGLVVLGIGPFSSVIVFVVLHF
jgi:hypothetical protein